MSIISNVTGMMFAFLLSNYLAGGVSTERPGVIVGAILATLLIVWVVSFIGAMICDTSVGGGDQLKGGE